MIVSDKLRADIEEWTVLGCKQAYCQRSIKGIRETLLATLASPKVIGWEPAGTHQINPGSIHIRQCFNLVNADGTKLRVGFVGNWTIMVFSRRKRYTHCDSVEFKKRINKFLGDENDE